jgi:transcription elongation factor SPT6
VIFVNNRIGKNKKYFTRKINHPKYKHMSLAASIDYINEQPRGDFVIRPSSKGSEFLTITWKFYEDCIVHLTVKEEGKIIPNAVPKLVMNNETYSSIDEIIERYI